VDHARRTQPPPLLLTDGWKAYTAALLQVVGIVDLPGVVDMYDISPSPDALRHKACLRPRGQGPHQDGPRRGGQQAGGGRRPRRLTKQLRLRQRRETIQTTFMERWYRTLRGLVALDAAASGVCLGAAPVTGERPGSW
jgi:hypothetical protein